MKFVQKLGKALMLPVACLPICGILMGLGYAMCPSTMQGGDVTGVVEQIGFFLVKAGGALIDHMALLFAIGVGVCDHQPGCKCSKTCCTIMVIRHTNNICSGRLRWRRKDREKRKEKLPQNCCKIIEMK